MRVYRRLSQRFRKWLQPVQPERFFLPEHWSAQRVRDEQARRLHALLREAAERLPFWRERLRQSGVLKADGVFDLNAFTDLPYLERVDLIENREDLADSEFPGETWWDQTGGSTGEPVRILKDADSKRAMLRAKWQMHSWAGHRQGQRMLELWGAERDFLAQRRRPPFWEWSESERRQCANLKQNAFRMGEAEMRQYLAEWHSYRPRTVLAYAHSIHELARFAEREEIVPYRPHGIITSAGTLTDDMRADIRRVFGAPVYNRYGSREFGNMAMSCERESGLHVIPTATLIEVVREDGSPAATGELGEIIVTSLTARAMPLIRYRIGDTGCWGESCACGRPFPVLAKVTGRISDNFITRDGALVHGGYFTRMLWHLSSIRRFQVTQKSRDHVVFSLVLVGDGVGFEKTAEESRLAEETRQILGRSCRVDFEYPSEIVPNATGKHRFTVSRVSR